MNLIKEKVLEVGIFNIIEDYKYSFEFAEKFENVLFDIKNKSRRHIKYRVMRNGYYRYSTVDTPNDVLTIHNMKTDRVSRLFNYNRISFGRKIIITVRLYCSVLPIYSNFN